MEASLLKNKMRLQLPLTATPSHKAAAAKEIIPSLNGLRAVSILMVLAYHFEQHHFFSESHWLKPFGLIFFNGPLGVNVFFVISGFLITTLLMAEKKRSGGISLRRFYLRRAVRIFPAYYFFVSVLFLLQAISYLDFPWPAWAAVLTYTKQFFPFYGHAIEHLWSLSVEEVFYLFWPLCFIWLKNKRTALLVSIGAVTLLRFFLYRYPLAPLTNSIFTTADALLVGCLIAKEIEVFKGIAKRFSRLMDFIPLFIFANVGIFNYLYHLGNGSTAVLLGQKTGYAFFGSIGLVTNFLIGFYVVHCVQAKGFLFRFLNTPLLNYIGILSYSIYLWQQLFTDDRAWLHRLPLPIVVTLIFLAALASYYFIEKPFLRFKHRFETPARTR